MSQAHGYYLRSAAKKAATGAAGAVLGLVAGTAAGIKQPNLTQKLITNIPKMMAQNWKESQILRYITDQIANSSQLNSNLLHKIIIKLLYTHEVLNKSEKEKFNYGKNIGKNISALYNKYKKIPSNGEESRYKNIKRGVLSSAVVQPVLKKAAGVATKVVGGLLTVTATRIATRRKPNKRSESVQRRRSKSASRVRN